MSGSSPVSGSQSPARILVFLWSPGLSFSVSLRSPPGLATWLCTLQVIGSIPNNTDPKGQTTLSQSTFPNTLCLTSYSAGVQPDLSREWIQKSHGAQGLRKSFLLQIRGLGIFVFVCLDLYLFYFIHACVCSMYVQYLWRPEEGTGAPSTEVTGSCESPFGFCEPNQGPLQASSALNFWAVSPPQLGTLVLNTFVSHIGSSGRSLFDRLTPRTTLLVVLWTPKLWRVLSCTDISRVFTVYQAVS